MHLQPSHLQISDRKFKSRLLLGTGKFASNATMEDAIEASGTEIVTVALRRADLSGGHDPYANILEFIDPQRYLLLPNTSGAMNAEEAVRLSRLAASLRSVQCLFGEKASGETRLHAQQSGEAKAGEFAR